MVISQILYRPVSCIINPFDESFSRLNWKNEAVIDEITSLFRWLNLLLEHFLKLFRELGIETDLVLKDSKNRSLGKVLEYN